MTIQEKYEEYVREYGREPHYVEASIHWKDNNEECGTMTFKLSCDDEGDDDYIFFYTNGVNDIISLTDKDGVEDFYILEDTVEFC